MTRCSIAIIALFLALGVTAVTAVSLAADREPSPQPKAAASEQLYTCPMHPQIRWSRADSCPLCGMKLVAAKPATPKSQNGAAQGGKPRVNHETMTMPVHAGMQMDQGGMNHGMCGCGMCMEMMQMGNTGRNSSFVTQRAASQRAYRRIVRSGCGC